MSPLLPSTSACAATVSVVKCHTFYARVSAPLELPGSTISGTFVTMFTPRTRVPAFHRAGDLTAVRWGECDERGHTKRRKCTGSDRRSWVGIERGCIAIWREFRWPGSGSGTRCPRPGSLGKTGDGDSRRRRRIIDVWSPRRSDRTHRRCRLRDGGAVQARVTRLPAP